MSVETVARRYATALADVVTKSGETDSVQTELKTWEEMIFSNTELFEAFRSPAISHVNKEEVLESLLKKSKSAKTTANFLRILLRNSRLTELSEINQKLASVLEERSGVISAGITSARSLSGSETAEIQTNLEKLTGKKIKASFEIDENIIGGIVIRVGSTVYDGSVKTKLEELKEKLVNG